MGSAAQGISPYVDTLANITAVSKKLSFVSNLSVSCLLTANLLLCWKGKNLNPMPFWRERKDADRDMALLSRKFEGFMVQFTQFEGSWWELVENMLTKLYGQSGNKWSSILLPGDKEDLGRGLQTESRKDGS